MSKSGNFAQPKGAKAIARIRNVGVIAHIDAGKTTLTERMLFYSGRIHRMGEVHEGAATMDFMPEEQERGITIAAACESWDWQGCRVNLIDTPGHVDFTIEVERSLRALDGAVGVFCGVGGVEPQSETVWRQSEKRKVPKLAFVNKMDRPGADFENVLTQMREILGARPVAVTFPVIEDDELLGVVDCLRMRSLTFDPASEGATVDCLELSPELAKQAAPWREKLVEAVCENDDGLLEIYLAGGELPVERMTAALRAGALAGRLTPTFAGSALRNIGVQPLMDAICAFLPSPLDVGPVEGVTPGKKTAVLLPPDENGPLGALVFKILVDEGARRLAVARIYSGRISEGQAVWNATRSPREGEERVSRLFALHAGRKERVESAGPGEIVALAGLKSARTGDSLSDKDHPVVLESIDDYRPVISLAIEPRSATETERLTEALEKYLLEDPTLSMSHDEATGQVILSGMGELHLEVVLQRLRRESGLDPRVGRPQVVSRETISFEAEGTGEFDRMLGDAPHHGYVRVAVAPRGRGSGSEVTLGLDPERLPRALVEAALEGVADGLHGGVTGNPVEDVSARVIEVRLRPGASSPAGQRMAGTFALKDALAAAGPRLLEPLMRLEIVVPQDHVGDVIGLVSAKGGRVENLYDPIGRSGAKVVSALAPLRDLFGFSTELRSATQGRAGLTMRFERFDAV